MDIKRFMTPNIGEGEIEGGSERDDTTTLSTIILIIPWVFCWQEDTGGPVVVEESYWMMGEVTLRSQITHHYAYCRSTTVVATDWTWSLGCGDSSGVGCRVYGNDRGRVRRGDINGWLR